MRKDFGCLMVKVNVPNWGDVMNAIAPEDLVNGENLGLEKEPHITVVYGIHQESVSLDQIKSVLPPCKNVILFANSITCFENENYDVLKFDIHSEILKNIT